MTFFYIFSFQYCKCFLNILNKHSWNDLRFFAEEIKLHRSGMTWWQVNTLINLTFLNKYLLRSQWSIYPLISQYIDMTSVISGHLYIKMNVSSISADCTASVISSNLCQRCQWAQETLLQTMITDKWRKGEFSHFPKKYWWFGIKISDLTLQSTSNKVIVQRATHLQIMVKPFYMDILLYIHQCQSLPF